MTGRERILNTIRREPADGVPFLFSLTPALQKEFENRHPGEALDEYYGFPIRYVRRSDSRTAGDFSKYYRGRELCEGTTFDEWGIAHEPSTTHHFEHKASPLAGDITLRDIEEYPWPDFGAAYRCDGVPRQVEEIHASGCAARWITGYSTLDFSQQIRGYEQLLIDMIANPDIAAAIMDNVCTRVADACAHAAAAGCDIVGMGEDVGSQRGMIISPAMWREWIKPRFKKIIDATKDAAEDMLFFYHSDGDIRPIIPDLIELGVDVLNPIQPECMDPAEIKDRYGDRLSFWGTIGTQTTMPFGTPDDVRSEVKERIETVGKGGGLVLAPSHVLEPEVPWENVEAFVEAAREYGAG